MYMLTTLGEPESKASCSGWESDPESFSKRVAEHYVRTVLGQSLSAKRIVPYWPKSKKGMEVIFSDDLAVGVSFVKIPHYVIALRLRVQPPGPPRYYTYFCTPDGDLVLAERKKPTAVSQTPTSLRMRGTLGEPELTDGWLGKRPVPPCRMRAGLHGFGKPAVTAGRKADLVFDKFEFGLSIVPAAHKPVIEALADRIVAIARQVPGPLGTVRLVGHTDFIDTEKYNEALGLMRAKAVRGVLATALEARLRGVTSRVEIIPESRGELQPVTKDASLAGRGLNRRVEVFLALKFAGTPRRRWPDIRLPKDYDPDRKGPPYSPPPSPTDRIITTKVPKLPRKCVKPYDVVVQFLRRLLDKALERSPIPRRFHDRIRKLAEQRAADLRDDLIDRGLDELELEGRLKETARRLIVHAIQQACI
jgi:hypothetical protein